MSQNQPPTNPAPAGGIVYAYTQHETAVKTIENTCNINIIRLKQDRTKDAVEDVLSQMPMPYTVMPYDEHLIEDLKRRAAQARVWIMELGGRTLAVANVPPTSESHAYTALPEEIAVKIKEKAPWLNMKTMRFEDKSITVIEGYVPIILYAVLPMDKAVELKMRAPWIKLLLMQLDGKFVEQLTKRPYDPKADYPDDVIKAALKIYEVKSGYVRHMRCIEDLFCEVGKQRKMAVFNDVMREALRILMPPYVKLELVKTCDGNECAEVNPLGLKSGYRISLPGTVGRLTAEQMAEVIASGQARIYYVDVEAQEVPLCNVA
jgi:hypothetical protein